MATDPDLTPVEGPGALRLLADQAAGNDDETRVSCPRCQGRGTIEQRTESTAGYSVRWGECWLCLGSRMVTPRMSVEFARIVGRTAKSSIR